jgi:chitinase
MKRSSLLFLLLFLFLTSSAQRRNPRIIAYYTGNGETIRQHPVSSLTHIIYSFLKISNDTLTFHNEKQKKTLQQLVRLKQQYPQLKIMVSIGGWSGCAPCSDLFASEAHRRMFAKTTVQLFREYNVDGIDLDWEYPAIEGFPGHKYTPADKDNFTALVKALREEMGEKYILSFAAGGFIKYLVHSIDWVNVMPLVDFVNLMTYDLVGGYSTVTGHHTPLMDYREGQESTNKCVTWLLHANRSWASRLIIGAAFYARVWENVPDSNKGLYQPGKFKQGVAFRDFNSYFSDSSGFTYYWDKRSKAPWRYNREKKIFATFDDRRSIRMKCRFVRRKKLGGIMFWELSQDLPTGGLVDEMKKRL